MFRIRSASPIVPSGSFAGGGVTSSGSSAGVEEPGVDGDGAGGGVEFWACAKGIIAKSAPATAPRIRAIGLGAGQIGEADRYGMPNRCHRAARKGGRTKKAAGPRFPEGPRLDAGADV